MMRTFFQFLAVCGLMLTLLAIAAAAEFEGILMDKACSASAVKGGEKVALAHTRDCALMPDCVKSGYGIFMNDKFIPFDATGNKQALAALKVSNKPDNLRVKVTGEQSGNLLKVKGLKLL
jgi:hypothetical protein